MKIERIILYKNTLPLKEPFLISLGPIYEAQNIVVRIETDTGIFGMGECSPYPTIHGETQEGNWVIGQWLAKDWIGKSPLVINERMMDFDRLITGNPCIKSAFDMALFDLKARFCQLPLYELLGAKNDQNIVTDMTVSIDTIPKMVAQAKRFDDLGFPVLKVKLGGEGREDVARIRAIREAIGMKCPIRIDANQGWDVPTAIFTLKALEPYHIQHCEAPIPRWNRAALPEIRQQSPIPIMADEALFDHHDAIQLVRDQAVDRFNIKLSKAGGIRNALQIAAIAEAADINCQVGSFSESGLGISALLHFALACRKVIYFDLDAPLMLADDPTINGLEYGPFGSVTLPNLPGIGADLSLDYRSSLEQKVIGKT